MHTILRRLSIVGLVLGLVSCATAPTSTTATYPLETIMASKHLSDGWNYVCSVPNGVNIYAEGAGGRVVAWQAREADGTVLPTYIRPAANPDNLRLWFEPTTGPGRFIEAPAYVLKP